MNKAHEKLIGRWIKETARRFFIGNEFVMDREDLEQAGWVSALVAYESWQPDGGTPLQTWIISGLRRDMGRLVEKEKQHQMGNVDIDDLMYEDGIDELTDFEEELRIERLAEVSNLVDILSEREANVVRLYYFEDLSEQEIGDLLSVSRSMVQKIHRRALEKLRERAGYQEQGE